MRKHWIALLIPLCPLHGQERAPNPGQVSLPLEEFKTLWSQLTDARRTPPQEVAPFAPSVTAALVEVLPHEDRIRTRTTFEVQALNNNWTSTPLLPASAPILAVEPADAAISVQKESLCLLSNKQGKQKVTVESALEANGMNDGQAISLVMPQAASVTLQVKDDSSGRQPIVQGAVALGEGKYVARAGAAVTIRLVPRETAAETPAKWKASREIFVRFQEERVEMVARVILTLEENGAWAGSLLLPTSARVTDVKSDDLAGSRVEPFNEKLNRLALRWSTPNTVQREVIITMSLPVPLDSKWALAPPLIDGEKDPSTWFGLVVAGDGEVVAHKQTDLPPNAEPGLWLQKLTGGKSGRYALGHPSVTVSLKTPSVLATPQVTCSVLEAQTKLVADGASVSDLTYTLRHEPGAALRIQLPEGAVLLSSRMGSVPAQAVKEESALRIRLSAERETKLTISYHQKGKSWDPLRGAAKAQLPQASLMVEKVAWKVLLPADYEIEAFEGNVASSAGENGSVFFQKELCNEEAPFADLFYRKHQL